MAQQKGVPTTTGVMVGVPQRRNQRRNSDGRSEVSSPQTSQLRQMTQAFNLHLRCSTGDKFHNLAESAFLSRLPEPEDVQPLWADKPESYPLVLSVY
jgi:hypothetical protein